MDTIEIPLDRLHIIPGYKCNFSCAHCADDSGPDRKEELSSKEIANLESHISRLKPRTLSFTGGEPFLYVPLVNRMISAHPSPEQLSVSITTNGYFSKNSKEAVISQFKKIIKIDSILLSFDKYRTKTLTLSNILTLRDVCKELEIAFDVSLCITDPLDTLYVRELLNNDVSVVYQKVDSSGRAHKNQIRYNYPLFEKSVLDQKCPNLESTSYICGKGFSICCSNLIFNDREVKNQIVHDSWTAHSNSEFYQRMSKLTLGEQAKQFGIDVSGLDPKYSSACALCELIHEKM